MPARRDDDPTDGDPTEPYRTELRAWLVANLTDRHRGMHFEGEPDDDWLARMLEWNHLLADAGYAAPSWPAEWGGRGAGLLEMVAHAQEMATAQAPGPINAIGVPNIAPAILAFGTDAQKERLIPPLLRGDEIWCQGFSEPDAGSDLASLSCRAERDGDDYVVTGQKVWTTYGQIARWCELLVRTDPAAAKPHKGITCLLVDMTLPGITVAPLRTITGSAEFNEVFLDGVRVPVADRLGAENDGWMVAMATLMNERSGVASLHLQIRGRIAALLDDARKAGATDDPVKRQLLAGLWADGERLRMLADRVIASAAAGKAGAESSVIKLAWSELGRRVPEVAVQVLGMEALAGGWGEAFLTSPSLSIAGGTTEVNKNIVAERALGLPKG